MQAARWSDLPGWDEDDLTAALFETPVITIPQAQRILGVTYVSAQRDVGKLLDFGILRAVESGTYAKSFIASRIVGITNLG